MPSEVLRREALPAALRVRSRRDFEKAYAEGYKVVTPQFALYARPNGLEHSRLGITATRKIGKAVRRNRARRTVRQAYRKLGDGLPQGYDFVVVARAPLLSLSAEDLQPILLEATRRAARQATSR